MNFKVAHIRTVTETSYINFWRRYSIRSLSRPGYSELCFVGVALHDEDILMVHCQNNHDLRKLPQSIHCFLVVFDSCGWSCWPTNCDNTQSLEWNLQKLTNATTQFQFQCLQTQVDYINTHTWLRNTSKWWSTGWVNSSDERELMSMSINPLSVRESGDRKHLLSLTWGQSCWTPLFLDGV